ncbi:hypothetical protein ACFQJ7_15505 [Halovenus rubra]|uniref:Secreted protein n=2 Tax=Halovenus rubra TaxID=869890 RepID=A0ABD5X827_9EURY|nr:hypothetical protein [Halovenus rubra]
MKRRSFLATTALGATVGLSGCLDGKPVLTLDKSEIVPPERGLIEKIEDVDGSGEIKYTIRSEHNRFEVFYFRDPAAFTTYQKVTLGGDEMPEKPPTGYQPLRAVAAKNSEQGAYEAKMPTDGGRHSLDFDGTHYLVVDHSNYGNIEVPDMTDELQVFVGLEVIKDRF